MLKITKDKNIGTFLYILFISITMDRRENIYRRKFLFFLQLEGNRPTYLPTYGKSTCLWYGTIGGMYRYLPTTSTIP